MQQRHFLTLADFSSDELQSIIERACVLKKCPRDEKLQSRFNGRILAMIFEKSSTRTRVSFETAMVCRM